MIINHQKLTKTKAIKIIGQLLHLAAEAVHRLALEVHQVQQLVHLRSQNLWGKEDFL